MAIHRLLFSAALVAFCLIDCGVIDAQAPQPSIRQFDISTLEKLGRAIYEQDRQAATGTDVLFAQRLDLSKENMRGYIVEESGTQAIVRFVRERANTLEAAYDVAIPQRGQPTFSVPEDRTLKPAELAQFAARDLAAHNIERRCSEQYNVVVLRDPQVPTQWLAWALAATTKPNVIVFGGHYRFTLTGDGKSIVSRDALSRGCLTMDRKADIPKGSQPVAAFAIQLVSDIPTETNVYLSLLHGTPIYVATPDRMLWQVEGGHMEQRGPLPAPKTPPK